MNDKLTIHHIGYAVKDIDEAIPHFRKLGYVEEGEMRTNAEGGRLKVQFLLNQGTRVELISPTAMKGSSVENVLHSIGNTPYHICYKAENMDQTINALQEDGFKLIKKPERTGVIGNYLIAFLYHKDVGIIEIVEQEASCEAIDGSTCKNE